MLMKNSKAFLQIILPGIALLITAGCSTQQSLVYRANSYPPPAMSTGKKIAVLPFVDGRTNINQNAIALNLLPFVLYGWQEYNVPEGVPMHLRSGVWPNFKPTEDFPKALVNDLQNTGLFSDSFFSYQRESADYAVEGRILSTRYYGRSYSYYLGIVGVDLQLLGFPAFRVENDLSLELRLVKSATDETLFSKTYTATPRISFSSLYNVKSDFNYMDMMAEINSEFCNDIEPFILKVTKDNINPVEAKK